MVKNDGEIYHFSPIAAYERMKITIYPAVLKSRALLPRPMKMRSEIRLSRIFLC